jgi:hypothetical protein
MSETVVESPAYFGWTGLLIGAVTLVAALVIFWAGPFAPQQATGVTLGELAADVGKSALRSVAGLPQPEPETLPRDLDDFLEIAVAVLGGLAIVLGVVSIVRHEPFRPAVGAIVLAGGAILFQLFTWMVLVIVGMFIIMALLESFSGVFEGLFGG